MRASNSIASLAVLIFLREVQEEYNNSGVCKHPKYPTEFRELEDIFRHFNLAKQHGKNPLIVVHDDLSVRVEYSDEVSEQPRRYP